MLVCSSFSHASLFIALLIVYISAVVKAVPIPIGLTSGNMKTRMSIVPTIRLVEETPMYNENDDEKVSFEMREQQQAQITTTSPAKLYSNNSNISTTEDNKQTLNTTATTSLKLSNSSVDSPYTSVSSTKVDNISETNRTVDHTSSSSDNDGRDADEEAAKKVTGSISGFLSEARAQRNRIMSGGFIELIEWLFVFLLVAPGTFPAIGCVLYSCTNLVQRHFGFSAVSVIPPSSTNNNNNDDDDDDNENNNNSFINSYNNNNNYDNNNNINNNNNNYDNNNNINNNNNSNIHNNNNISTASTSSSSTNSSLRNHLHSPLRNTPRIISPWNIAHQRTGFDNGPLLTARTRHKSTEERDVP